MSTELQNSVLETAKKEGFFWGNEVAEKYFDVAERDMPYYWAHLIEPFLGDIEYRVAIDLAAGRGRNAEFLARKAERVICVELNPDNVAFLLDRFRGRETFSVIQNDGVSLNCVQSSAIDLVYCFDSMVHFDMEVIQAYVKEVSKVLRPGGHAFLHCSNYTENPGGDFRDNPHWRSFFSAEILVHIARRAGLAVRKIAKTPWDQIQELDCMALLQRPVA